MTTSRQHDLMNRLRNTTSSPQKAGAQPVSVAYGYNNDSQRTRATQQDGTFWSYRYDELAQVISGRKYWSDGSPVAGQQFDYGIDDIGVNPTKIEFAYDHQGRRVRKTVYNNGSETSSEDILYIYDGWNLIVELNIKSSDALLRTYVWGLDLSASEQGAGGVGGLLIIDDASQGSHFVGYDGNGNVNALVDAHDGQVSPRYEYGPFGESIRATGAAICELNRIRFPSIYEDAGSE